MAARRASPAEKVAEYRAQSPIWASLFELEDGSFVEKNVKALARLFSVEYAKGRLDLSALADAVFDEMQAHTLRDPDLMELDGFSDGYRQIRVKSKTWKVSYKLATADPDLKFDYSEYYVASNTHTLGEGRKLDFRTMAKIACAYLWIGDHENLLRFKGVTKRGILMYPTGEMRNLESYTDSVSHAWDAFVNVKPLAKQIFNAIFHLNDRGVSDVFRVKSVFVGKVTARYDSNHVPHNELPAPRVLLVPDFLNPHKGVRVSFSPPSPLSDLFPENASGVISNEDYISAARFIISMGWDESAKRELSDALGPYLKTPDFRKIAPQILKQLSRPRDPYKYWGVSLSDDDEGEGKIPLKRQRTAAAAAAAAALVSTRGDVAAAVELLRL